ncbi:hypothetical protein [Alkalilimnicola sp. S0819]|uniref:hypothetical protein n=1 Tax=Alkalilimnicola sp. S0819 TaxID=2613922 RepID=UPI0012622AB3|nr:hypothetical protein [Alkalilimnicola sp. S0819]KAB7627627.1 hypothetical protein F3N43_03995 [Alkalilimnicola sp. S0819]MPQ15790.1 hypothetical protein [Alkalilimnicola sp. S0819]
MPQADSFYHLIGRHLHYQGRQLQVVEVLPDGPALVLAETGGDGTIQANQFGEANRRVPETWTIPCYSGDGRSPHPLLAQLGLDR